MPRILVSGDNGEVTWTERVTTEDFATDHFRRCLADRLAWAVADASQDADEPTWRSAEERHLVAV
jgi:hypothetical protein